MNQLRFLSREKLIEYLDEELRLFLNDKGIYEIDQYGWLADDSPDPEYMGLAMWQIEPPSGDQTIALKPEVADPNSLSEPSLENIFKNGLEFEGLMKAARHSIGFAFLYNDPKEPLDLRTSGCFLYHYADAVMKLDLATDRLRELFTNSFGLFSEMGPGHNDPASLLCCMNDEHYLFCLPFVKTRDMLTRKPGRYRELLECFRDLVPLIEQTSFYRLDSLEQSKKLSLPEGEDRLARPDLAEQKAGQVTLDGNSATRDIAEWCKLLVKTGSQVFLAEYLYRNYDKRTPDC
jgi:hypothetical protein